MKIRKRPKRRPEDLAGIVIIFGMLLGLMVVGYWSLRTDRGGGYPGLERMFGMHEVTRVLHIG